MATSTSPTSSHILAGPKEDYDVPEQSIGKYIFDCLKNRHSEDIINVDGVSGDALTCGELLENSIKFASILQQHQVVKGDVIAIVSRNSIDYCTPVVAALYIGVIVNPLNFGYKLDEMKHALNNSRAKLIICSETALKTVLKVKEELEFIQTVLLIGPTSEDHAGLVCVENLLEAAITDTQRFTPEEFDCSEQGAFILLSSGTAGLPKGVLVTHKNLRSALGYVRMPNFGNVKAGDVTIQVLPYFHIFGLVLQLVVIIASMKSVVFTKFKADTYLKAIQDHKATTLFIVPNLLQFLAKNALVDKYDISSITDIQVGAAPVGKDLQNECKKRLGKVSIRQLYGLTETCGACTYQTPERNKPGSVGVLVPGILGKVCDLDSKEALGAHKNGELCFKGPMIMKGYCQNTEETKNCFDADGFYHTGDVGYYDEDGFFFIIERIKDLIKYKDYQVPPAELEALIMTHDAVTDCGVVGIPDERAGQVPRAYVVKHAGVSQQQIIDFVAERISIQKRLYGGVRFIKEIPKDPSGKILRRKLLELYQNEQS